MKWVNIFNNARGAFKFKFYLGDFILVYSQALILIILVAIFIYASYIPVIKLILFKLRFSTDTNRILLLLIVYLFLLSQLLGRYIVMILNHSLRISKCNMLLLRILIISHHLVLLRRTLLNSI